MSLSTIASMSNVIFCRAVPSSSSELKRSQSGGVVGSPLEPGHNQAFDDRRS